MKKNISFEEAVDRIEEIANVLGSGDAPLDDALGLYTEATSLIQYCNKKLDEAALKIEKLLPLAQRDAGQAADEDE